MKKILISTTALVFLASAVVANETNAIHQQGAVKSAADTSKAAAFDILAAHTHRDGHIVTFHMTTNGVAGSIIPDAIGSLASAPVLSYVWPTSLNPSTVGFEGDTGILALAVTSHPDFDDTPLFDENGDGDLANDGINWHSHWVVLQPTKACGAGALGVRDIPKDATPKMPATWPGLPIFIDSPGFTPLFNGPEVAVKAGFVDAQAISNASYDGVTAALQVNASVHAPLLCVTDVFDVASGDLSLPGKIE